MEKINNDLSLIYLAICTGCLTYVYTLIINMGKKNLDKNSNIDINTWREPLLSKFWKKVLSQDYQTFKGVLFTRIESKIYNFKNHNWKNYIGSLQISQNKYYKNDINIVVSRN